MAIYMKKSSFGRLVETEDINDPDITEIRLSPEEYDCLWDRIQKAEQSIEETEKGAEEKISEAYQKANNLLSSYKKKVKEVAEVRMQEAHKAQKKAEAETVQVINELQKTISERVALEAALEEQVRMNENLKRICRERANATRGLSPKKEREGYLVITSSQHQERYKTEKGTAAVTTTWRSVLQTPYDASMPLDLIQGDIWNDLMSHVLYQLGFRQIQDQDKNGEYRKWISEDKDGSDIEECGLYRWSFKANYKMGLWEMILYSTKSLSVSAEYRL